MRRDAPVFVGAVVVAVVLSLFTGATAKRHAAAPLGTAPVTARTLVCPAVNGLPQHTASVAVAADVGSALSDPVDGSGTVLQRFSPRVEPEDERVVGAIEKALA